MKATILCRCILVLLLGCGPKPSRQELRVGINGEAIYTLNKDGSVKAMFKLEYSVHDYSVLVKSDTVKLGEDFYSLIMVTSPKHSIKISSPEAKIISRENNIDRKNESTQYIYHPTHTGLYDYSGTIEFDSLIVPFSYRFIVVKPDH